MPSIPPSERTLLTACLVNGILGTSVGALAAGLPGAKIGLIVGLALAVMPMVGRKVMVRMSGPGGLPTFVGQEMAATAVAAARAIMAALGPAADAIDRRTRGPVLIAHIAIDIAAHVIGMLLAGLWRIVATPLGMANVAALGVIAVNLSGFEFAGPVAFLGLGMLLLVLLVSLNEASDGAASRKLEHE